MSEGFDPYHAWLGIPPEEQPPNCYRLLGLRVFEAQAEVIEHAADQRMAHLKSVSAGEHADLAQKLLNRVAAARVRLLDPYKKAMYDRQLRQELAARPAGPALPDAGKAVPEAEARTATWTPQVQLGEYQVLEKLGQGGMGTVYKALHTRLGRIVALKLLPQDRLPDEQAIARFDREMKAVGAVDDPNIVRAMDAREVEGTRFLVMEYVEGADLNELGRECHPLPVADACEIVRQAALGLEAVHRHGLVHRDVKPSNVIVTPQGAVKLLDLGLARFQFDPGAGDEVTGTGMAMGTVDYMAPEQISDSRSVDIRADIYGLGCTLYKLLAGRTPFSGPSYKTAGEKMAAHLRDVPPPVTKFREGLPAGLVRLLERMLAKEPAKRYGRPGEVADAIGPLAAGSDLASLVARARSEPAAAEPEQALVPTQEMASSASWTRFVEEIVGPAEATAALRPSAARPSGKLPVRRAAGLAVAAGALAAVVLWGIFFRGGPRGAVLVFDWPEDQRRGVELVIDGEAMGLPDSGPLEYSCPEGEHTISATRPGYRLPEQRVVARSGQPCKVAAAWLPLPNLKLDWPRVEREGAILEIDDQVQPIESIAARSSVGTLQLRLPPGEHALRITRLGYAPVQERLQIVEGQEAVIRPEWKQHVVAPAVPDAGKEPAPPKPEVADKPPAPPGPTPPEKPAVAPQAPKPIEEDPAQQRRRQLAARWAEAAGGAEKRIAAWDFAGAEEALAALRFEEAELSARLASRRGEVSRMAALKARIIARINAAEPRLKKSDLALRGLGGEILEADEGGITAKLISGKKESRAWSDVGEKAVPKILQWAVDAEKADDWLASGLMALVFGNPPLAERCFEKARELGTNIDPYLVSLAEASLARVEELLEKKDFAAAEAALGSLESKYAALPWLVGNQRSVDAARKAARAGIRESEAEKLSAEAADLFSQKELFDLKPIVDRLRADYPNTRPVTDAQRKPPFAELEKAVANLGKRMIVRQDGKGDFKSIQAAVDAAPHGSFIEIHDSGLYGGVLQVPQSKARLTLRGAKGRWPMIIVQGSEARPVAVIDAPETAMEHMIVGGIAGHPSVQARRGPFLLDRVVLFTLERNYPALGTTGGASGAVSRSFVLGGMQVEGGVQFTNCLFLGGDALYSQSASEFRSCTILSPLLLERPSSLLSDSIVTGTVGGSPDHRIENSNVFGTTSVKLGQGSFGGDPMFNDPPNLDFRLKPGSPCVGKASDGGDVGCRYTPEMIELCNVALQLRRRGIIKF